MKVKVVRKFNDLKENTIREIGDEFIVSKSRFEEIQNAGNFVVEIEEVEGIKKDLKKEVTKKNNKK